MDIKDVDLTSESVAVANGTSAGAMPLPTWLVSGARIFGMFKSNRGGIPKDKQLESAKRLIAECKNSDVKKLKLTIDKDVGASLKTCLLYTSPSPRDATLSRMPSSA